MHQTKLGKEGDGNPWVGTCLSIILYPLTGLWLILLDDDYNWRQLLMRKTEGVPGCLLFDLQPSVDYLEEHGDDVLVICSCWVGLAYLIHCMLLLDHLLFSYSSTTVISGVGVYLRKLCVLAQLST